MTKNHGILLRNPNSKDGFAIHELVKNSGILDVNSKYLYLLIGEHFAKTSIVACDSDKIIAFVSAYVLPEKADVIFIWQMAVDPNYQKMGLAKKMLKEVLKNNPQINFIHTTVSPSNRASRAVFKSLATDLEVKLMEQEFFNQEHFHDSHETEPLLILGPLNINK